MPNMSAKIRAGLVLAGLSVAALAHAGAWGHRAGSETWTEPAGAPGTSHAEAITTQDYNGLQTIKIREYDRRPCVVEVEESPFAVPSLALIPPIKVCDPTGGEIWKRVDVGNGVFITGIATCTSGVKGEAAIHGLEAWGVVLQPDGALTPRKGSEKMLFDGCKKWSPKKTCPAGAVATGLRADYDDATRGFVGLSLRCHALEPRGKK
jgi:hypothetical protein